MQNSEARADDQSAGAIGTSRVPRGPYQDKKVVVRTPLGVTMGPAAVFARAFSALINEVSVTSSVGGAGGTLAHSRLSFGFSWSVQSGRYYADSSCVSDFSSSAILPFLSVSGVTP